MSFLKGMLGSPDVGKMKAKGDVKGLIKASQRDDPAVREAALDALVALGQGAVPPLVAQLTSGNGLLRANAVGVLTRLNWQPANLAEQVTLLAARQNWTEIAHMGEPAVPALIELLKTELRPAATALLGYIGGPAAVDILVQVLEQSLPREACQAWIALSQMGTEAAQRVVKMLVSPVKIDRVLFAAQLLGVMGPVAVPPLLDAIPQIQEDYLPYALMSLLATGDPRAPGVVREKLLGLYEGDLCHTLQRQLVMLDEHPDHPEAALIVPGMSSIMASLFGNRRLAEAAPVLVPLFRQTEDDWVSLATITALGKIGDPAGVQEMVSFVNVCESVPFDQIAFPTQLKYLMIISSLGQTKGNPAAASTLARLTKHESVIVQAFATVALEDRGNAEGCQSS